MSGHPDNREEHPGERAQTVEAGRMRVMDLVERARAGKAWAMNELIRRYYPCVHRFVQARLGRWMRAYADSDDVVQDTFYHAVRIFGRFEMRDSGSLERWLTTIAKHVAGDLRRRLLAQKRRRPRDCPVRFSECSALARLIRQMDVERVRTAVRRLQPRYRQLIRLRHYEGLEWKEVAERTGKPSAGAARMAYQAAIRALRVALKTCG